MEGYNIFVSVAFVSALICAVGLLVVGRCVCLRYFYHHGGGNTAASSSTAQSPPNGGPKEERILSSVPRVRYTGGDGKVGECAICLTEFMKGDEMSVMPQCGHGFHVKCIERWMRRSSSCPWCRQILVEPSRR